MKLNFKEFLVDQDKSSYGRLSLISEGLQGIKSLAWSGLDLLTAMQVIGYSPEWNPNMMFGEVRLKMLPHQVLTFQHVRQNVYSYLMKKPKPSVRPIKNAGGASGNPKIEILGAEGDDSQKNKYYSKYFGMLMKFLGQCDGSLRGAVKRDGGNIVISATDETAAKNAFAAVDLFNSTAENARSNLTKTDYQKAVADLDQEKFKKSAGTDSRNDNGGQLEFLGQGYLCDCLFMFAAVKAISRFDEQVKKFQDICPSIKTPIEEYTPDGFRYLKEVVRPIVESIEDEFKLSDNWVNFLGVPDNSVISRLEKLRPFYDKHGKEFDSAAKFDGEIPEKTRWLLTICNKMLQDGPKVDKNKQWLQSEIQKLEHSRRTPDQDKTLAGYVDQLRQLNELPDIQSAVQLIQFLKKENVGFMISQYENRQSIQQRQIKKMRDTAKKEKKPFDEKKAAAEMLPNIMTAKSIADVKQKLGGSVMMNVDETPNLTAPAAIRRVKLFQDVKARGADVFNTKNWFVAILHTQMQSNVFGRTKPKVLPGTNTINDQLNRNDDEPGLVRLTAAQIKQRDASDGQFVKDNLGYDSYGSETGWCTNAGYYSSYGASWNDKKNYSFSGYARPVLIVLMNCKEGRLYQYGGTSFLSERDDSRGYCQTYGTGIAGFKRLLAGEKELHYAFIKHNIYKYLTNYIQQKDIDGDSTPALIQTAQTNRQLTPNGGLLIKSKADLVTYRDLFSIVTEIVPVNNEVACGMFFDAASYEALPPINCSKITSTCSMFEGLRLAGRGAPIVLRQTSGVKLMRNMFKNSNPTAIIGLDTSSAVDITNIMRDCKQIEFRPVDVQGRFDLKSCSVMDGAFYGCGAQSIDIVNTDNVKSAKDAFIDCFMLKTPPNAMFKRIQGGHQLVSDFNGNYEDVFAGCTELLDNFKKLDEVTDALRKFYEDGRRANEIETDSRGFAVVHDRYDTRGLLPNMSKYPGIVLAKDASSEYLFDELKNISIKVLDLNGIEKTDKMFYGCQIRQIGKIIGTKNVKSVNYMFQNSHLPSKLPLLELPALTGKLTMFADSYPSKDLPVIDVGPNFTRFEEYDDLPQPGTAADELNRIAGDICSYMFGSHDDKWLTQHADNGAQCIRPASRLYWNMIENADKKFKEQLETDERGYVLITRENYMNLQQILNAKPAGLIFDKSIQAADVKSKLFSRAQSRNIVIEMPPVDMSHITDASRMFSRIRVASLILQNTDNIVDGTGMFEETAVSVFGGDMSFKSLKTAARMFNQCNILSGICDEAGRPTPQSKLIKLATPVLENAEQMFYGMQAEAYDHLVPDIELDTKQIKNAQSMFEHFQGGRVPYEFPSATDCTRIFCGATINNLNIASFKFPSAVSLQRAFYETAFDNSDRPGEFPANLVLPKSVTDVSFMFSRSRLVFPRNGFAITAENVTNAAGMFLNIECVYDSFVVNCLDFPRVTNISEMFERAFALKRIMRFNAPNIVIADRAFEQTRLLGIFIPNILRSTAQTTNMFYNSPVSSIFGASGERLLARARVAGR